MNNYYDSSSRYRKNIEIVNVNLNNRSLAFPLMIDNIKFLDSDIQSYYNVQENESGRLDLIANRIYANPRLWWAIAIANNIEDTLTEPIANTSLKIPSVNAINRYIY